MAATKIYNHEGTQIYPQSEAAAIIYSNENYTNVKDALDGFYRELKTLAGKVTGSSVIEARLAVDVKYSTNNEPTTPPMSWGNTFGLPTALKKYAWKKTEYKWAGDTVATTTEIVATALFPETQFLFCSVASSMSEIRGPLGYPVAPATSIRDKNNSTIWHTTPLPVSPESPVAYMATRTRQANLEFRTDGSDFGFAVYGNYAFSSTIKNMYYITSNTTCPDPETVKSANGELPAPWVENVNYADLQSGTNYIFQTHATVVNNNLQTINNKTWDTPSLISIINK